MAWEDRHLQSCLVSEVYFDGCGGEGDPRPPGMGIGGMPPPIGLKPKPGCVSWFIGLLCASPSAAYDDVTASMTLCARSCDSSVLSWSVRARSGRRE